MVERDVPVLCAGVLVRPGDYVFGDADGVVVIPEHVAEATFSAALAKVEAETTTRDELAAGETLGAVFQRHGIL
jgi:regulator of RNase E activity RraA